MTQGELEMMLARELFRASDPELIAARNRARVITQPPEVEAGAPMRRLLNSIRGAVGRR